jgi:hypothetical protein
MLDRQGICILIAYRLIKIDGSNDWYCITNIRCYRERYLLEYHSTTTVHPGQFIHRAIPDKGKRGAEVRYIAHVGSRV